MPDTDASPTFAITPFDNPLGTEVTSLDLRNPLDDATRDAVYSVSVAQHLLVFCDESLTKPEQITFSLQFGNLEQHTLRNHGAADEPFVHIVSNLAPDRKPTGKVASALWHTDKSRCPHPSLTTSLHAERLPPYGGDTVFANMQAAYAARPDAEKQALDGVNIVHSSELSRENVSRVMSEEEKRDAPQNLWTAGPQPPGFRREKPARLYACVTPGRYRDDGGPSAN